MNEQTTKLIEQLANKLGTTSEYLWSILINQAPVDATMKVLAWLGSLILVFIVWRIHFKLMDSKRDISYSSHDFEIPVGIVSAIVLIALFFTTTNLRHAFNGYFNPEFWALDYIIRALNTK